MGHQPLAPATGPSSQSILTEQAEALTCVCAVPTEENNSSDVTPATLVDEEEDDDSAARKFWTAVCENGAASEVVVNVWLPWFLSDWKDGTLQMPSTFAVNATVLWLNLLSAWMEGFAKSTRLLTQTLHRTNPSHQAVFVLAHGFSLGFLNVSSSFPDIGGGASDAALAVGNSVPGIMYIVANIAGSLWLYRAGRLAGWRAVQRNWSRVQVFCRLWPIVVRVLIIATFIFVWAWPHPVPLDLGYPEMSGIDGPTMTYKGWVFHIPPQLPGLACGILMSVLGCIAAALCSEFWTAECHRCLARLGANFTSTVVVLIVQWLQDGVPDPSFALMKFSSSFCGAFSAFSSTIGDVFDDTFGAPDEEVPFSKPEVQKRHRKADRLVLTGPQNLMFHTTMTVLIMVLGIYVGHNQESPRESPILLQTRPCSHLSGAFVQSFGYQEGSQEAGQGWLVREH